MKRKLHPIAQTIQTVQRRFSRLASYTIFCLLFLWGTLACYSYLVIRYQSIVHDQCFTTYFNNLLLLTTCRQQTNNTSVNTHCKDNPQLEYCQFPPQKKFTKFLGFFTDCWPVKYGKEVMEHYKVIDMLHSTFFSLIIRTTQSLTL
jgi:hypothetical protein